jgi:dimethylhistidine N-methyltransferase
MLESAARLTRSTLAHVPAARASFAEDVRTGLTAPRKFLLPQYFYDALGSALFGAICELPEYYVTRAETEILALQADEIARAFSAPVRLVELGSGYARKTRLLFDAVMGRQDELEYVPIDIDPHVLEESARELLNNYPRLRISAVAADFRDVARAFATLPATDARTVVLFLGSTIGNLDPAAAALLLREIHTVLTPQDALFLGADLVKPLNVLEPAYDDALGVTAAFNRNLLARINRELGGHFELSRFTHRAFFNRDASRIEMHLVSLGAQRVVIDDLSLEIDLADGESIHTENSYKYDDGMLAALAREGGFSIEHRWSDTRAWFADVLMVPQRVG